MLKKYRTWLLFPICCLFLYCSLGFAQALFLGGAPNYSHERLINNLVIWGLLSILCFLAIGIIIFKSKR